MFDKKVALRIDRSPDSKPHDHGTGFRVPSDRLDLFFIQKKNSVTITTIPKLIFDLLRKHFL